MGLPSALKALQESLHIAGDGEFSRDLERELGVLERFLDQNPVNDPFKGMMRAT